MIRKNIFIYMVYCARGYEFTRIEKNGAARTFDVFLWWLSERRERTPPLAPSWRKNCSNPGWTHPKRQ